jgi:SNF2 family DNA or RNA helicase
MHSRLSFQQRQELIEGFQDTLDMNGEYKQSYRPDILLGTTGIMATGHTCTRAFRLILLEPDFVSCNEEQLWARINRISQKNPQTYTYRLVCRDSEVEAAIVDRQQKRQLFQRMTFERSQQITEVSSDDGSFYEEA